MNCLLKHILTIHLNEWFRMCISFFGKTTTSTCHRKCKSAVLYLNFFLTLKSFAIVVRPTVVDIKITRSSPLKHIRNFINTIVQVILNHQIINQTHIIFAVDINIFIHQLLKVFFDITSFSKIVITSRSKLRHLIVCKWLLLSDF